ncbi:hypothetical protein C4J81_15860 [Deltaproteobacteria bacterium Smac51]|nr:hypothetical protein C4J81_15860 [Deltaproteobacteria bacterium Smac51]
MQIGNRSVDSVDSIGSGLSIKSGNSNPAESTSEQKNSIYSNFEKEMSRRLTEAAKKSGSSDNDEAADPSILAKSLTRSMGEIEQIFGREAATEVMAKVLTGTAKGVGESELLSSIQNGLAGLSPLDPNGTKMKQLTEGFNQDLSLALDPELAEAKLQSKETLSLSYAISSHFGSLAAPENVEDTQVADDQAGTSQSGQETLTGKTFEMAGFNETGSWDTVKVSKLDDVSAEKLREAAEEGLSTATSLTMADIMENTEGHNLFYSFASYLNNNLQDKESAAFVEQCIADSYQTTTNQYGKSPKMADMLSQVYSKVASDGDADKLALLENYINTDFKEAVNPILSQMQQGDGALSASLDVGTLQFKGITGASLAGESDAFSLNWGYKEDDTYDKSISKRFMQEDIRGVKAAKEKNDQIEEDLFVKNWDDSDDEKRIDEAKESRDRIRAAAGRSNPVDGTDSGIESKDSDLRSSYREKFDEEHRQKQLEEAMTTKFGQLSDSSRDELENYLRENFSEEEAEKFLEHTDWNNDIMSGLADIQNDIRESGAEESKVTKFVDFLNGTMKEEVDKISNELGGLSFEGWQTKEGVEGELQASFQFTGQENMTRVTILGAGIDMAEEAESLQAQAPEAVQAITPKDNEQTLKNQMTATSQKMIGTGYLVDLLA